MKKPKLTPGWLCRDRSSLNVVFFPLDAALYKSTGGNFWYSDKYRYFEQPCWTFKDFMDKYDCNFSIRPGEKLEIWIEL